MKKEALVAIMATTLLVLSLLSPVTGAVGTSYAADSGGDSVSISESYDVDETVTINETPDISFVDQGRTAEGTGEADGNATAAQETEVDAEPGHADSTEATIDDEVDNAPVATNKKDAIEDGLAWLETQQDPATGAWNLDYYPVGSTAFAVLKFEEHAWNILDIDPFSGDYIYKDNIVDGWKYIFEHAVCIDINREPAGNPDGDNDWKGVYFMSPAKNNRELKRPVYETGIVMMALGASRHPEVRAPTPSDGMGTWTYRDYMQDMVDWVSWAQNDEQNYGVGGWAYGAYDDGALKQPAYDPGPPGWSDNSVSQWSVIGLMSAAAPPWGIKAPSGVTTELLKWLTYSQDLPGTGCFHYCGPDGKPHDRINIANTAAGLIELTYCGVTTDDERWAAARRCICENWTATGDDGNIGNLYAMYGVMKAAMTADDDPIKKGLQPVKTFCGHDWQEDYDDWLVNQTDSPPWSWSSGWADNSVLATEWALLILQKVVPPPPYCPLQSFEDLLKSQEKLIKSFEDLLNETWDELTPAKQLEFLESFEDLLKSQEELIKSFEDLLNEEWDKLSQEDQIGYLRSFEDLLKSQAELLFSFEDLLKRIDGDWLDPWHYDPKKSFEDLLKSQAELLFSFEDLLNKTLDELSPSEQLEFLESFEDLLKSQEELIKSFEDLLNEEWDNLGISKRIGYLRSFEELLKSQEELLFSFEDLLKRIEEDGLG